MVSHLRPGAEGIQIWEGSQKDGERTGTRCTRREAGQKEREGAMALLLWGTYNAHEFYEIHRSSFVSSRLDNLPLS